uniref:Uncharacterized protein n=1 Tax=Cacopsylla melanoneura TaxID=428564 RepID=A0A8D8TQI2_9HEMI
MEFTSFIAHRTTVVVSLVLVMLGRTHTEPESKPLSRQKRFLWFTEDGELTLPAGSCFEVVPTLTVPLYVSPDTAFCLNLTLSLPFDISFDSLGVTSESNPFGSWHLNFLRYETPTTTTEMPEVTTTFFNSRHDGYSNRWARNALITGLEEGFEGKKLPSHVYGGERVILYKLAENLLTKFQLNGNACLLRAICEVQAHRKIHKYGLLGEALKLFLTPSRSLYAIFLVNYLQAENRGKKDKNCWPYFRDCPVSLFGTSIIEDRYREIRSARYHHWKEPVFNENEKLYM